MKLKEPIRNMKSLFLEYLRLFFIFLWTAAGYRTEENLIQENILSNGAREAKSEW